LHGEPTAQNRRVLHKNAKIDLPRRAPLFERCSGPELSWITTIADELDLPPGRNLTQERKPGPGFRWRPAMLAKRDSGAERRREIFQSRCNRRHSAHSSEAVM
jgi:hypothetical protein